jgi:hypothetical protein
LHANNPIAGKGASSPHRCLNGLLSNALELASVTGEPSKVWALPGAALATWLATLVVLPPWLLLRLVVWLWQLSVWLLVVGLWQLSVWLLVVWLLGLDVWLLRPVLLVVLLLGPVLRLVLWLVLLLGLLLGLLWLLGLVVLLCWQLHLRRRLDLLWRLVVVAGLPTLLATVPAPVAPVRPLLGLLELWLLDLGLLDLGLLNLWLLLRQLHWWLLNLWLLLGRLELRHLLLRAATSHLPKVAPAPVATTTKATTT